MGGKGEDGTYENININIENIPQLNTSCDTSEHETFEDLNEYMNISEPEDMICEYEMKDITESNEQKNDPNDIDEEYFKNVFVSTAAKMKPIMDIQADSMNLDEPNEQVDTRDTVDDKMDEVKEALELTEKDEVMDFDDENTNNKKHLVGTAAKMVPDVDMLDVVEVGQDEVDEVLELREARERRNKI